MQRNKDEQKFCLITFLNSNKKRGKNCNFRKTIYKMNQLKIYIKQCFPKSVINQATFYIILFLRNKIHVIFKPIDNKSLIFIIYFKLLSIKRIRKYNNKNDRRLEQTNLREGAKRTIKSNYLISHEESYNSKYNGIPNEDKRELVTSKQCI